MNEQLEADSRKRFEAHLKDMGQVGTLHTRNGEYVGVRVSELWAAWKAGQESMYPALMALAVLLTDTAKVAATEAQDTPEQKG